MISGNVSSCCTDAAQPKMFLISPRSPKHHRGTEKVMLRLYVCYVHIFICFSEACCYCYSVGLTVFVHCGCNLNNNNHYSCGLLSGGTIVGTSVFSEILTQHLASSPIFFFFQGYLWFLYLCAECSSRWRKRDLCWGNVQQSNKSFSATNCRLLRLGEFVELFPCLLTMAAQCASSRAWCGRNIWISMKMYVGRNHFMTKKKIQEGKERRADKPIQTEVKARSVQKLPVFSNPLLFSYLGKMQLDARTCI